MELIINGKFYDPHIRRVHLTWDVRCDANFSYYDYDIDSPLGFGLLSLNSALRDIWSPNNDADPDVRRHHPEGARNSTPMTPDSMPRIGRNFPSLLAR